jgi:hypothetical protein
MFKSCWFWSTCHVVLQLLSSSIFWIAFSSYTIFTTLILTYFVLIVSDNESLLFTVDTNERNQTLTRTLAQLLEMIMFCAHKERPLLNDRHNIVHAIFWIRNTKNKKYSEYWHHQLLIRDVHTRIWLRSRKMRNREKRHETYRCY